MTAKFRRIFSELDKKSWLNEKTRIYALGILEHTSIVLYYKVIKEDLMIFPMSKPKELGDHVFITYDSLETFREFYSRYTKEMLGQNRTVLIFPYFETVSSVLRYLGESFDVAKHREDGSLIILDAYEKFFATTQDFVHYLAMAAKYAKDQNKKGISAVVDISAFDHGSLPYVDDPKVALAAYEDEIRIMLSGLGANNLDAQIVCCYHRENYEVKMTEDEKRKLTLAHASSFELKGNGSISTRMFEY